MKVIEAIDMFICISYEFCTLPSGQGSIPAAHIPRSNKLNWFSSRLWGAVEICAVFVREDPNTTEIYSKLGPQET